MNESTIKITCHVKLIAKPGKLSELLDALEICAASSRQELDCEYYEILQNIANPNEITLIEKNIQIMMASRIILKIALSESLLMKNNMNCCYQ